MTRALPRDCSTSTEHTYKIARIIQEFLLSDAELGGVAVAESFTWCDKPSSFER
jgi:hypothetical protein